MHSRIMCILLITIFSAGLLSCAKNSRPATLSFQFAQKNQSLNDESPIRHLVVNVSAPDMALVSQEYDCRKQNCQNVNIAVTAGSNRILQILMVYDTDLASQILYGDVTQNLNGGDNRVEINLTEIGNFVSEGEIIGRYVPSASHPLAGKLLTGDVNVWARVESGKPNMRIMRTEIFGGWVNLFALDNLGFRFTFTGFDRLGNSYQEVPLFNDLHDTAGMILNSAGLQASQRKIARYSSSLPVFNTGPEGVEERPFETLIVGFFGANPDNKILCSDPIAPSFSFYGGADRSFLCRNSSCNTYFTWADIQVQGLVNGTDSICASNTNEHKVNLQYTGYDDKFIDFSGPLLGTSNTPASHYDPATSTLTWRLNPNAYLPAGLEIFVTSNPVNVNWDNVELQNDDGYNCSQLTSEGFQSLGTFTGSGTLDLSSYSVTGNPVIAICPKRKNGGYFSTATLVNRFSAAIGVPLATGLQISKPASLAFTNELAANVCHPIIIEPVDDAFQPAPLMNPIDIDLSSSDGMGSFYEDSGCSSPISSVFSFYGNRHIVYYKSPESTGNYSLWAQDNGAQLSDGTLTLNSVVGGTLAKVELIPAFYRKDSPFEMASTELCIPFQLATLDANDNLGAFAETVQFNPPSGVEIYANQGECENSMSALPKSTDTVINGPIETYWLGRTSMDILILDILSSCLTGGVTCQNKDLDVIDPGPFHHFHVDVLNGPSFLYNSCMEFKLGAYDNSRPHSYPVTFSSAPSLLSFTVSDFQSGTAISFGGTFYSEQNLSPTCLSGGTMGPFTITPSGGDTKYLFQFKPGVDGDLDLDIQVGAEFLQQLNFMINP